MDLPEPDSPKINFNPRTPRGVRLFCSFFSAYRGNFNPRTPRGVRPVRSVSYPPEVDFNPRTPRGVRRPNSRIPSLQERYFNPRTPRGVRPISSDNTAWIFGISIHAPREGCDLDMYNFNTIFYGFQSTHPARGAT